MGFISAVVAIEDAQGERIDLPASDGTRRPIKIRLSEDFEGASSEEGSFVVVLLSLAAGSGGPEPWDDDPAQIGLLADPGESDLYARGDHVHELSQGAIELVRNFNVNQDVKANETYTAAYREIVQCNPDGGGPLTINLPTAVGNLGAWVTVKNVTDSSVSFTVEANGSEEIDGAANDTLAEGRIVVTYVSDGADWLRMPGLVP